MDSIPVVAITGQVGRALIGTDAFQKPTSGITMPDHPQLPDPQRGRPARVAERSISHRPAGRVSAIDIPRRCGQCTFSWPPRVDRPATSRTPSRNRQGREAAKLIAAARKPVLRRRQIDPRRSHRTAAGPGRD
jgi:acetolactate synthase-1/2/3 large subunit